MSKKNIGFLSYWGNARGLPYVTLCYSKMIHKDYNVFVLKQGLNEISEEFKEVNAKITEYPNYIVEKNFFVKWIKDNNLDAVVFNEYHQWTNEPENLVKEAKDLVDASASEPKETEKLATKTAVS